MGITILDAGKVILHVPVAEDATDEDKFLAICETIEQHKERIFDIPKKEEG